jgi:hypothetical protein
MWLLCSENHSDKKYLHFFRNAGSNAASQTKLARAYTVLIDYQGVPVIADPPNPRHMLQAGKPVQRSGSP